MAKLFYTLLTAACFLMKDASAQFRIANSSRPFSFAVESSGPFDLFTTYPFYSTSSMINSAQYVQGSSDVYQRGNPGHPSARTLTGWIPTYTIYYGSGHSDFQKNVLDNLIRNLYTHSMWNVVRKYGAGNPYFNGRLNVACSTTCTNAWNCFPCTLNQFDEQGLLYQLFNAGRFVKSQNAIYVFILGTNVQYTLTQTNNYGAAVGLRLGDSQVCGTHDYADHESLPGYPYITVPLLKSAGSPCNFLRSVGYPNNNFALDSSAAILAHELVEMVLPAHSDAWSYQIADKCANRVVGVGTRGTATNVVLGGQRYLLPPIWDQFAGVCSMG